MTSQPAAQTVDDALRLLEVLATMRRATLTEVAAEVGMTVSKTHRMLTTLEGRGYLNRVAGKAYELGPALLHLGHRAARGHPLLRAAAGVLDHLSRSSGESSLLAIRVGTERLIVDSRDAHYGPQMAWPQDARLPLNSGALGICLLAHASADVLHEAVRAGLTRFTEATVGTEDELRAAIRAVRQEGVYVSKDSYVRGVYSIAAPVLGADRHAVAAVAVVGDAERLDAGRESLLKDQVRQGAADVARLLT